MHYVYRHKKERVKIINNLRTITITTTTKRERESINNNNNSKIDFDWLIIAYPIRLYLTLNYNV